MSEVGVVAHFEENREKQQEDATLVIGDSEPADHVVEDVIESAMVLV